MNKTEDTFFFKATAKKIKVQSIIREVLSIEWGALVVFIATVRKLSMGSEVERDMKPTKRWLYKNLARSQMR